MEKKHNIWVYIELVDGNRHSSAWNYWGKAGNWLTAETKP